MTTRIPEGECLQCGKKMDAASNLADDALVPEPGDVTLCIHCGYIMAFADDLTFRAVTEEEIKEIPLDEISRFQRARKVVMENRTPSFKIGDRVIHRPREQRDDDDWRCGVITSLPAGAEWAFVRYDRTPHRSNATALDSLELEQPIGESVKK